jgi:acyl carrier protein
MSNDTVATVLEVFRDALRIEVPAPDTDVIAGGLLDSLALVTLLFELEQRYSISIPFESLETDDFRTPESIARVVEGSS